MRQLIDLQEKKKREKKREPLVPVGNYNRYLRVQFGILVEKKVGRPVGVEPCQRSFHFPPVAIEILRRFVLLGQRIYKIKVFKALGTGFMKPPGTLGFSFPAFGGLRNRVHGKPVP